jgi:hypothetical protein
MGFGGGIPAVVFRPVHAVGHQFQDGGVHHLLSISKVTPDAPNSIALRYHPRWRTTF